MQARLHRLVPYARREIQGWLADEERMDRSSNKGWPAAATSKDRRWHGIFSIGLLAGMFFQGQALAQELPVV